MPVFGPQGLKMHCQADGTPSVHFCGLPLQLRYPDLRGSCGVSCRDVEVEGKFIALQIVDVPALARPFCALLVAGNREPI